MHFESDSFSKNEECVNYDDSRRWPGRYLRNNSTKNHMLMRMNAPRRA